MTASRPALPARPRPDDGVAPRGATAPRPDDRAPMTHPVAVVLAGGLGTRMKSRTPKLLHPLCGRPMLAYVLDAARAATGADPVVVVSPATAAIREAFPDGVAFALQERPDGTGDALRAAWRSSRPRPRRSSCSRATSHSSRRTW